MKIYVPFPHSDTAIRFLFRNLFDDSDEVSDERDCMTMYVQEIQG
jgi:hypothetical protein